MSDKNPVAFFCGCCMFDSVMRKQGSCPASITEITAWACGIHCLLCSINQKQLESASSFRKKTQKRKEYLFVLLVSRVSRLHSTLCCYCLTCKLLWLSTHKPHHKLVLWWTRLFLSVLFFTWILPHGLGSTLAFSNPNRYEYEPQMPANGIKIFHLKSRKAVDQRHESRQEKAS